MKKIDNESLYEAIGGIGEDLLNRSEEASFTGKAGEIHRQQEEAEKAKRERGKIVPLPGAKKRAIWTAVLGIAAIVVLGIAARVIMRGNTLMGGGSAAPMQSVQETEAVSLAPAAATVTADAAPEAAEEAAVAEAGMEEAAEAEAAGAGEEFFAVDGGAKSTSASAQAPADMPLVTEGASSGIKVQSEAAAAEEESVTDEEVPLFFTFEGRRYDLIASDVPAEKIRRGEEAAYIERRIDETTPEADYLQEKAGSVRGMAYEVEGYDKEGLLCMETEAGTYILFVSEDYASVPRYTEW